ncbi:MAG: hypothetical protein RIG62_30590 [Cyclobacteriaceae bacterium]
MCYITDHILPGTMGKTFIMGADHPIDYKYVLSVLNEFKGISSVQLNDQKFPCEMTIQSNSPIAVKDVQQRINTFGFHALPKSYLLHF